LLEFPWRKTDNRAVPLSSRICEIVVLFLALTRVASAVEKGAAVINADLVVVGQLKFSSYFLSFDGIHANGTIVPTEVLFGNAHPGVALKFHNVEPCSAWDAVRFRQECNYRAAWDGWSFWKERINFNGIWALQRGEGSSWKESPGPIVLYPLSDRDYVLRSLKTKKLNGDFRAP
jgi:hypothetical protein